MHDKKYSGHWGDSGRTAGEVDSRLHSDEYMPLFCWTGCFEFHWDLTWLNPYWTGRTYMSLPGKGRKGHICLTIVTSWWRHFDFI